MKEKSIERNRIDDINELKKRIDNYYEELTGGKVDINIATGTTLALRLLSKSGTLSQPKKSDREDHYELIGKRGIDLALEKNLLYAISTLITQAVEGK